MRFTNPYRDPAERNIEHKLNLPVSLNFKNTALGDAIDHLRLLTGVNIVPDYDALKDAVEEHRAKRVLAPQDEQGPGGDARAPLPGVQAETDVVYNVLIHCGPKSTTWSGL